MEKQTDEYWISSRLTYIKGLKSPSEQQSLLVLLAEKKDRTLHDEKKLNALIKAEKANIRASQARQNAANLINAEKKAAAVAARKARDHEMYQSAGLLSLAGLVDKETGMPARDRGALLGALIALSKTTDEARWSDWKRHGDALLAKEK